MATYTVQPGETLPGIARSFLGDPGRWRELQLYNQHLLVDPGKLAPGMVLTLPPGAAIPASKPARDRKPAGSAGVNRARALRRVARSSARRPTFPRR